MFSNRSFSFIRYFHGIICDLFTMKLFFVLVAYIVGQTMGLSLGVNLSLSLNKDHCSPGSRFLIDCNDCLCGPSGEKSFYIFEVFATQIFLFRAYSGFGLHREGLSPL